MQMSRQETDFTQPTPSYKVCMMSDWALVQTQQVTVQGIHSGEVDSVSIPRQCGVNKTATSTMCFLSYWHQ